MFLNRIHTAIIVLFSGFIIISACSEYEQAMKSEDVNVKFRKAFYYYKRGEFVRASSLFEQLAPLTRGTRRADSVYFFQAMTQYKLNDYIIAGHYFNSFVKMYENSIYIEEATYMEAYCYYLQSPRPELDQTSTYQALDAFRLFMIRYPHSSRIAEVQRLIKELNEKLMEKDFIAAKLYYNIADYKAAVVAFNSCLIEYPDSKFREEIMFLLLKSKYFLAVNSIPSKQIERYQDTVDEYYSFVAEFPESMNKLEANDIYQNSSKYITETDTETLNN
jgi:outer membrane protein assembly factor BamD